MPAYLIITVKITDRDAFLADYAPAAAKLVERFGGRYVLRAPGAKLLEGAWGDGASVVISEWQDRAAAEAFWTSPDYAEVKAMRNGICEAQVLLIEGELA